MEYKPGKLYRVKNDNKKIFRLWGFEPDEDGFYRTLYRGDFEGAILLYIKFIPKTNGRRAVHLVGYQEFIGIMVVDTEMELEEIDLEKEEFDLE